MTTKTLSIADSNLISGSSELIRQALGGYWQSSPTTLTAIETLQLSQRIVTNVESNYSDTNTPIDPTSLIDSVKFASRLYSTTNMSVIRSDEEWKAYVIGGTFGDRNYSGVYDEANYFDHNTTINAPLYKNEITSPLQTISGESVAQYCRNYERYQNNLVDVASEHLIPNYYFLRAPDANGFNISQFVNLEGSVDSSEISDLFGFTENVEISPRFTYENVENYLNIDYSNHKFSDELTEELQNRLQNIILLNPQDEVIDVANNELLQSDFEALNNPKKANTFSLMPISNRIYLETSDETGPFNQIIASNDYAPRFMKTLKEVFADEIPFKPIIGNFEIRDNNAQEVSTRQLRIVDLPEMVLYDYENLLSRTDNCTFFNNNSVQVKATFDANGTYRFINSEIAANTLNDLVGQINTSFVPPQSLEGFLNAGVGEDKQQEILAYRVQKIGGPPTGDLRTENTLQNFWFYNAASAIEYIDTQVKYGTNYTYKIFAFVAVLGYKYRLSDLAVTRQIAKDEDIYCLEFYDPSTGNSISRLLNSEVALDLRLPISTDGIKLFLELNQNRQNTMDQIVQVATDSSLTLEEKGALVMELDLEVSQITVSMRELLVEAGIEQFLNDTTKEIYEQFQSGLRSDDGFLTDAIQHLVNNAPLNTLGAFSFVENNSLFTNSQTNSFYPYLADFNINIEPSLKIVEVPIQEKTFKILDNPPNDLIATPHHIKDQSNRLAFFLSYDTFSPNTVPYPVALTSQDDQNKADYLAANDLAEDDFTQSESVSMAETFEVYRLSRMPTSYQDFENNLRKSIDLRILKQGRIKLDAMFMERVRPNQKYYYTFRAINENGIAGEFTPIFEAELINDGGYVYANFNQLSAEDLVMDNISEPLMSFKKLFNVVPNIQHLILDPTGVDFSKSAFDQVGNFKLGTAEEPLFSSDAAKGKTFKLRLTSKKTGKKIDLNITFNKTNG